MPDAVVVVVRCICSDYRAADDAWVQVAAWWWRRGVVATVPWLCVVTGHCMVVEVRCGGYRAADDAWVQVTAWWYYGVITTGYKLPLQKQCLD